MGPVGQIYLSGPFLILLWLLRYMRLYHFIRYLRNIPCTKFAIAGCKLRLPHNKSSVRVFGRQKNDNTYADFTHRITFTKPRHYRVVFVIQWSPTRNRVGLFRKETFTCASCHIRFHACVFHVQALYIRTFPAPSGTKCLNAWGCRDWYQQLVLQRYSPSALRRSST